MRSAARPARAQGDRGRWIGADDYPAAALRDGSEGTVAISVSLDAGGRVRACEVTASSGQALLDRATCGLYAKRARYAPALDEAGNPIGATVRDRVTWRLPR
jgi:periplasmic protein TonB